jgi:hypothetical protein
VKNSGQFLAEIDTYRRSFAHGINDRVAPIQNQITRSVE